MRGLTVVVAGADPARFDAALTLVNAQAALGGRARLYCHDAAVTLLTASTLLDTARELGVRFVLCQTALAAHDVALPEGTEAGGMIGLVADLDDDRLVVM
ncbi:MAG: peroxiredoxin [Pseudomonadota bacterium]